MCRTRLGISASFAAVVCLGAVACAFGADESAAPAPSVIEGLRIDDATAKALKNAVEFYAKTNGFTARMTINIKTEFRGMKQEMTAEYSLAMLRPNKFAMVIKGNAIGVSIISDGKDLFTYLPMMKSYTVKPAPAGIAEILADQSMEGWTRFFPDFIFVPRTYEQELKTLIEGKYVALEQADGAQCNHIKIVRQDVDLDVWLDAGEKPLVRKVVPDLTKLLATMAPSPEEAKEMKMNVEVIFQDWDVSGQAPESAFVFTPPADARKVKTLAPEAEGEEAQTPPPPQ